MSVEARVSEKLAECQKKLDRREHKFSRWKSASFVVGGLSAVLSATAGVAILTDWWGDDVAGAIAVAAGVITAVATFYDFDGRTVRTGIERAAWGRLLDLYRDLDAQRDRQDPADQEHRLRELDALFHDQGDQDARARSTA